MNKVISIHLCGVAFQLEESGYEALRAYLEKAERQLGANPDKSEILADIERAIADKFRALLAAGRNVVLSAEVDSVIKEMGPVTNDPSAEEKASNDEPNSNSKSSSEQSFTPPSAQPKRLYRLKEGAMLSGVCNGLAAYIGIDVTLLRLVVAILVFFSFGTVAIAYIVGVILIPEAESPQEKAAATGPTPTAQEFIRRAKAGYYEGFKTFGNREAHRAWKRKFKNEMRDWKHRLRRESWSWNCPTPPPPPVCTPSPPPPPGFHTAMPVLDTLRAILLFLCWFAIILFVTTGSVFGITPPDNLPMWAGIVLLVLAYKIVVAPIKALRRSYYYRLNGWPGSVHPFAEFWHGLLTVLIVALGIWMADHFIPGFHQALVNLPSLCHHVGDSIQQWWNQNSPPR